MPPSLAVILVTPDDHVTLRTLLSHLQAQTIREQIEIVVVAPQANAINADEIRAAGFGAVREVEHSVADSSARARAAGVRVATAPIVAFAEDHAFPNADWAQALVAAHQRAFVAVGPAIANANPTNTVSWVNFLIEYGEWFERTSGETDHLPGHNSSYQRASLLAYGDALSQWLDAEYVLQKDLLARGHRLYLQAAAVTRHLNFARWLPSLALRFNGGRVFASARSRSWSLGRRLGYAIAAPLIPWVRLAKLFRWSRRSAAYQRIVWRILPALIFFLGVDAFGEMMGYALGAGASVRLVAEMEFHRERYL